MTDDDIETGTAVTRRSAPGVRPVAHHDEPLPAIERFEIRRPLGRGGMGVVYEAFDRERGAVVALKALSGRTADSLLLFKNEFRALQSVHHPNVVQLGELFEHDGGWYLTQELVEGVDFLHHCRPDGAIDVARLRAALRQLVDGVSALHAHHKIHRDLKPSNVMVTEAGRVVVLDFGLVADTDEDIVGRTSGTRAFMAPEQVTGDTLTAATDWYAVGVMLYQALTGALPFGGSGARIVEAKALRDGPAPRATAPDTPADLDELCQALLRRDPARRPADRELRARVGLGAGAPAGDTPLFGRVDELATLRRALDDVARGAVVLTVEGASGVGKSALARAFTSAVESEMGAIVLWSRCLERDAVRFKAIDGLVDALARRLTAQPALGAVVTAVPDVALLAEVFPVLAPWVPVATAGPAVLDPGERRRRVFAALRAALIAVARERRVVVIVDDLQWADQDSLDLLRAIVRPPGAPALLALLLRRPGDAAVTAAGLDTRHVELGPLDPASATALATRLWSDADGDDAPAETGGPALAAEAAGHPLFIAALVRHARRGGGAAPRLDDALRDDVERAGDMGRRLLRLLAVAGGRLTLGAAAQALDVPLDVVMRTSPALRGAKLIGAAGAGRDDELDLFHDRIREAILDTLPADETRALHEVLAGTLEASPGADPDALAHHWLGALRPERARDHLVRAAERATAALAFVHAARLYERAVPLFDDQPERQTDLAARRGIALATAGHAVEAAAALLAAAARSPREVAVDLERRAGEQLLLSGHTDDGLRVYSRLLETVGLELPPSPRRALAALAFRRAQLRLRGVRFRARDESTLTAEERLRVDTAWAVGAGLSGVDLIRGAHAQTRSLLLALDLGEPYRVMRALSLEASLVATAGPRVRARAEALLVESERLAAQLDRPHATALAHGARGVVAWFMGEFADAVEACDRATVILRDRCTGVAWELDTTNLFALLALHRLGRVAAIRERTHRLLAEAEERRNRYASANLRALFITLLALADDRPDDADAAIAGALEGWPAAAYVVQHYNAFVGRVLTVLYRGDGAAALALVTAEWPRLQRSFLPAMHQLRIESRWLRGSARIAAGPAHATRARADARAIARERSPWGACLAALLTAGADAVSGRDDDARAAYTTALALADARGLTALAAAARFRLGELVAGDEGGLLRDRAAADLRADGVADPARFAGIWAPRV
jgi:tetratricopeptide (TPR) repeat protein